MACIDEIEAIGIDDSGSLWVKPATADLAYVWREAMEVHWDPKRLCLFSPKPREWTHLMWFKQIWMASHNTGWDLALSERTRWVNISSELEGQVRAAILEAPSSALAHQAAPR